MFVIYQGSGGVIHLLGGLVYCIEWCQKNNHHLIIDIKNHISFKNNFDDFFYIKQFTKYSYNYDIIPNNIKYFQGMPLERIKSINACRKKDDKGRYLPGYWIDNLSICCSLESYKRSDIIKMYVGHGGNMHFNIIRYIGVKPDIINICKEKDQITSRFIGVHFRNTDRINDINTYINNIKKQKNKLIYLATDDSMAFDIFVLRLDTYEIIQYTKPFNGNGQPIHIVSNNMYEVILNLIIDMYMLLKCDIFIPSPASLVSKLITLMRNNKKNIFT